MNSSKQDNILNCIQDYDRYSADMIVTDSGLVLKNRGGEYNLILVVDESGKILSRNYSSATVVPNPLPAYAPSKEVLDSSLQRMQELIL